MSLDEFDLAQAQPGYLYELGRGVVVVSDVPGPLHFALFTALRRQLAAYDLAHPGTIYGIGGGGECKILLPDFESERHPDISVYKTVPPASRKLWARWVPEVVV